MPISHDDRVFAFGVGIGSMIPLAYNDKSKFYITDSLDAQRLYNTARNLEIAAWKLANARGPNGDCCCSVTRWCRGRPTCRSSEFGKLIAYRTRWRS